MRQNSPYQSPAEINDDSHEWSWVDRLLLAVASVLLGPSIMLAMYCYNRGWYPKWLETMFGIMSVLWMPIVTLIFCFKFLS